MQDAWRYSSTVRGQMFGRLCVARVARGFIHHRASLSDTGTCVCTVLNNHWLLYQHLNLRFAITLTAAPHNEVHKNSRWILPFETAPSGYRKHACDEVQQIKTVYVVFVCWTDSFAMRSFMKTNGLFVKAHKGYKATYSNVNCAEVLLNSPPLVMHHMTGWVSCCLCLFVSDLAIILEAKLH